MAVEPAGGDDFWRYAVALYGRPGVADSLISLQDADGADALVLLLICWLADAGWPPLSPPLLERIVGRARPWNREVVQPLRRARRAVKRFGDGGAGLYEDLKAVELAAERAQISALEALAAELEADVAARCERLRLPVDKRRAAELSLAIYFNDNRPDGIAQRLAERLAPLLSAAFPSSA